MNKLDTSFTMYIGENLPIIEYGENEGAEWLTMEEVTMFISKNSKKILGQMIDNLHDIYKNLKEES